MGEKRISDFLISSDILGKGSFSTVYLGSTDNNQKVAVKVIPREKIKESQVKYFVNEINLLRKCHSPYIVKFIDMQKSKTNFYIFLEYCNQGNLQEYIRKSERLSEKQAMKIFIQLVKGMNAMKKLDIIHRDIKPANIMFRDGKVKYVDFGLATKFYDKGELMKTFAGSPFNMAPEILHGRPYDDKVDIYSLGTVLYEMLYGVRPFGGASIEELIANIEGRKFFPADKIRLSKYTKELLKRMLISQPEKRISYADLVKLVAEFQKQELQQVFRKYQEMYQQSRKFCFMFGGLAAPLLGMRYPFGMGLWERNPKDKFESQVDMNMKGIFSDFKCGNKFRKNPWDMDLRVCCGLYRELANREEMKEIVGCKS